MRRSKRLSAEEFYSLMLNRFLIKLAFLRLDPAPLNGKPVRIVVKRTGELKILRILRGNGLLVIDEGINKLDRGFGVHRRND